MRTLFWLSNGWRGNLIFYSCIVLGCLFIASAIIPLRAYHIVNAEVIPNVTCAGDPVRLEITQESTRGIVYSAYTIRVSSAWVEKDSGETYPNIRTTIDIDTLDPSNGKSTTISPVVRTAPDEAGVYDLRNSYDVFGRTLLLPAKDTFVEVTESPLKVLPPDSPECQGDNI